MQLIDHVSITVRDLGRAKPFYRAVITALGAIVAYERENAIGFGERNRLRDDRRTYISVYASPAEMLRAFHAAGPGFRSDHPGYFAAFLRDPEGNKVEAVFHVA